MDLVDAPKKFSLFADYWIYPIAELAGVVQAIQEGWPSGRRSPGENRSRPPAACPAGVGPTSVFSGAPAGEICRDDTIARVDQA
ncbi:hypothetical protein ACWCPQ_05230 [Nocardia sp. NPDC001965]